MYFSPLKQINEKSENETIIIMMQAGDQNQKAVFNN